MLYRKNLPGWERAVRTIAGIAMIGYGLFGLPGLLSMPGAMAGYLIAGTGAVALLSGFFGFCPMCAMVGRKLPSP
jgi:Inner membrane protein YgaP-like, transmembrane domain